MAEPPLDPGVIRQLAKDLGEALIGRDIDDLFRQCGIPDETGESTKWKRLDGALGSAQAKSGSGNSVLAFVQAAMHPARWTTDPNKYRDTREEINKPLRFAGWEVHGDGKLYRCAPAQSHAEAGALSRRLRRGLTDRGAHAEVFRYCELALVNDDYFDAVFEAVKGMCARVRNIAGLADGDGHELIQTVFEGKTPLVAFNTLQTETERNEQRGLANMMKGVCSAFRNPAAHEPKIRWPVSEAEALDVLSTLSLIHRRLDRAVRVP